MLTKTVFESLLIIIGESFMLFAGIAQLLKLIKTRDTAGLSAVTLTLYAAGNIAWMAYFANLLLWVPFVTNLANFFVTIAALGFALGNRMQFKRGLTVMAFVGPLTGILLISFPLTAGWIAFVYNVVAGTPAFLRVVRCKRVSGLSEHSIYLAIFSMILTLIYALLVHATSLIASCAEALTVELIVLCYYYRYRPTV